MRILITGGFGYLGGRLARFLEQSGNHTIILGTRGSKVKPEWLPNSEIVKMDWDSRDSLNQICKGVDVIIHLAGMNASECAVDPVMALEFNGVATARIIQAAVSQKVKRFIYFSTAHVYDSPLAGDINENTLPKSLHPYATSHRAAEDVVMAAHSRKEITGIVFRMSNAFGAPVNIDAKCWMLLVNDLCKQVVKTQKMLLNSSGTQLRDFLTITDVCRATLHMIYCDLDISYLPLFNLGGGCSLSVMEMAQLISQIYISEFGKEVKLICQDPKNNESSYNLIYNIDLLKRMGFHPQNEFREEISQLLAFCNKNFNIND